MANSIDATYEFSINDESYIADYTIYPGCKGVYHLAPEDCYPSEPMEVEITKIYKEEKPTVDLIEEFDSEILDSLTDEIAENCESELEEPCDY